jgi:2-oxoglutarate dehydrogenase E2 component (dihydrolipoamide succinyltransferase)
VAIGSVIGRIEPVTERTTPPPKPDGTKENAAPPIPPVARQTNHADAAPKVTVAPQASVSPAARQLAADQHVDISQLAGTGRGGRVMKEDVLKHLRHHPAQLELPEAPATAPVKPQAEEAKPQGRETRQRMSSIRQRIAERLVVAQHSAAHLTTFNEADLSGVMGLRAKYKDSFQKKHGVALGFMSFFVKACVEALKAFPLVNARIDGNDIVYHNFYDLGVAVSTEKGLMVPVVRNADRLSFAEIERNIAELADKARAGKIAVQDLQGGTFTITNGGVFGSLLSTPLINPPQSGILGMHTIQKRPVVVNDQIFIRPMMYLALTYDHRLIDGREAVGFLLRVKECIEAPDRLLLDV